MTHPSDGTARVPRLVALLESPIQYHAPLFKHLARDDRFRLKVLYMSRRGVEAFYSKQLKMTLKWDIPVLEGYDHAFLKNHSPAPRGIGFWSHINLGVMRAVAAEKPDAVWVHGYSFATCWLALAACRARGIPVFVRGESEDVLPRSGLKRAIRDRVLDAFLKRTAAALYIGTYNRQFYLNHGVPEDRLFYVPYSVDNDWFDTRTDECRALRAEVRARLGAGDRTVVFVLASKHRPDRYPMDVIEAFCSLSPEQDAALLVLGDGELRPALEAYAREHGEGRRILFAGLIPQSQFPGHMGAGDVLVQPSSEPWGCVINEGIAASLAVISSDQVLGWPDMVQAGVNGMTYPFHDVPALARSMAALSGDPERVAEMRVASRRLAEQMSFQTCADGIAAALARSVREPVLA